MKFLILSIFSFSVLAGYNTANSLLRKRMNYDQKLKLLVDNLVEDGLYYSSIPWIKEYLVRGRAGYDSSFEKNFSKVLKVTGTAQFETLPVRFLKRSKLNTVKYILGKKLIKNGDYNLAQQYLNSVNSNHSIFPFAANALATSYSVSGNHNKAIIAYNQCVNSSQSAISSSNSNLENNQLKKNKDYCTLGVARTLFSARKYKEADLKYLDIPKSSPVWPFVLFDEAWNSYYLKNYNRTLGKLVTYKAPIFDKFFNPEFDVLKALSYLKMCLYSDAKEVSDNFYKTYMSRTRKLRLFLRSKGKNYNYYYRLYTDFNKRSTTGNTLLDSLLDSFATDGAIENLQSQLEVSYKEYATVKYLKKNRLRRSLLNNLKEVVKTQRILIGSYVRSRLIEKYAELYRGFEGMSYIKLEVLSQRKAKLYNFKENNNKKRGDIKYLERNEKQYFWNFNGEFWADELGDYVFALRSEC